MKKIILTVISLVVIAVIIFAVSGTGNSSSENGDKLVKVERGEIVEKAMAIGQIEPYKEIAVKSKISGIVKKLYVEVGDKVKRGDPLMDIEPQPTPLEYTEAKRSLEIAEVNFENSQREYKRNKELYEKSLIPKSEFDGKEADYSQTKLRLQLAKEKMELLEKGALKTSKNRPENTIVSPIQGTVLAKNVNEGDPVTPLTSFQDGTELIFLAEMTELIFRGTVDEIDVGKLTTGMPVIIKIGAIPKDTVKGILYKISPKARKDQSATVFDVEINLTDLGNANLRAGYSANAEIKIIEAKDILVIPERLITFEGDSAFVNIQDSTGNQEKRAIEIGLSDGITIEVVSGLEENETVVEAPPREIM